jgi:hypothetical protein
VKSNTPTINVKIASVLPALLTPCAHAQTTCDGTSTETVTTSNNLAFTGGQQFTGSYNYESPIGDGTFYTTRWDRIQTIGASGGYL